MQMLKKLLALLTPLERKRAGVLMGMIMVAAFLDMLGVASILPFMAVLTNSELVQTNALLNTAGGATWVSLHHGGGVGMGFSQHSGVVIVADGTDEAEQRLARVLWNDPATGVMRHADAGYDIAKNCAQQQNLDLPMLNKDKS